VVVLDQRVKQRIGAAAFAVLKNNFAKQVEQDATRAMWCGFVEHLIAASPTASTTTLRPK